MIYFEIKVDTWIRNYLNFFVSMYISIDCTTRNETRCTNISDWDPHKTQAVEKITRASIFIRQFFHDWFSKFIYSSVSFAVRSKTEWRTLMEVLCILSGRYRVARFITTSHGKCIFAGGNTQYSWLVNRNGRRILSREPYKEIATVHVASH